MRSMNVLVAFRVAGEVIGHFAWANVDCCAANTAKYLIYEKVIKVKADVAALLNLFSDVSIDVR
jgi:hypothetical protein